MPVKATFDTPSDVVMKLVAEFNKLQTDVASLITKYNALVTLVNELKTDLHQHTHSGVTAGTDNTGPGPAITSASAQTASVTAQTIARK